ncbi:hypothetical protein DFH28DRAFT_409757 [Melampsora americana]|nr:hypothetical protein DFH28DRAFT_409757 [Melampsora americana]
MATESKKVLRWAILAAGKISKVFVDDLLIDPATREVSDVSHKLVAVGSRSIERAQEFINSFEKLKGQNVQAYGSYEELVKDQEVDIVYIGSPHSLHHIHAKLCLLAGKHVLCEKPMTVNAKQAEEIFRISREKQLFVMEGLWTRFFPLMKKLQEVISSGTIGDILQVHADFGMQFDPIERTASHRIFDPMLAGGGLLDLGPYSWTMLAMTLLPQSTLLKGHKNMNGNKNTSNGDSLMIPKIKASAVMYRHPDAKSDSLKIDASTIAIIEFPTASGDIVQGIMETSITRPTIEDRAVTIYGSTGQIRVGFPTCAPHVFFVTDHIKHTDDVRKQDSKPSKPVENKYEFSIPGDGLGYMWQADEAARCIFSKQIESPRMPHEETILMMKVFDEIRNQIGLKYPSEIEKL